MQIRSGYGPAGGCWLRPRPDLGPHTQKGGKANCSKSWCALGLRPSSMYLGQRVVFGTTGDLN